MRVKRYKKANRGKAVLLLAVLALFFTYAAYPYFYSFFNIKVDLHGLLKMRNSSEPGGVQEVLPVFNDNLLLLQDDFYKVIDGENNVILEGELPVKGNILGSVGQSIVATDDKRGIIYGINSKGEVCWEFGVRGNIQRIGIDKDYIYALVQDEDRGFIQMIGDGGNSIASIPRDNFEVLDVSVSAEGKYIAISTLELDGGEIISRLIYYDNTGTVLWSKEYYDNIVMGVEIINSQDVLVLNEQSLAKVSNEGNTIWEKKLGGYVSSALLSPSGLSLIVLGEDYRVQQSPGCDEKLMVIDKNGNNILEYTLGAAVSGIVKGEGCIAVYSSREIKLIDHRGKKLVSINSRADIDKVFLLGGKYLVYLAGGEAFFHKVVQ